MSIGLLVIDPQNDFHDIGPDKTPNGVLPTLSVPGSCEDSKRLSDFMTSNKGIIDQIYVTLDTHAKYDIGHPSFWKDEDGNKVRPFTEIKQKDIESGRYIPVDSAMFPHAIEYARSLESAGRFTIMVWPEHCIKGSWGYQVFNPVKNALDIWSASSGRDIYTKEKGKNPLTEHYGAFAAEYQMKDDRETSFDVEFLDNLAKHDTILVGGQALSHCVGESIRQMVMSWPKDLIKKIILLKDASSPVPGFEGFSESLVCDLESSGIQVKTIKQFQLELGLKPL